METIFGRIPLTRELVEDIHQRILCDVCGKEATGALIGPGYKIAWCDGHYEDVKILELTVTKIRGEITCPPGVFSEVSP